MHSSSCRLGSRWVHGEDFNSLSVTKIYNQITDMALSRLVSGRFQRPQACHNCPPFTPFIRFFWLVDFYLHFWISFKLLMKNTRIRCHVVTTRTRRGFHQLQDDEVFLNSVHFILHSRQYHTRSIDCFPTRLPSKTSQKCFWSGTWNSLYQSYDHIRRIFSSDGHCQWRICGSGIRRGGLVSGDPTPALPSCLRRWLRTRRYLMHG